MTLTSLLAFLASAAIARKREPNPKDVKIAAQKAEIINLCKSRVEILDLLTAERKRSTAALERFAQERDTTIQLRLALAGTGREVALWRSRAEQLLAASQMSIYPPIPQEPYQQSGEQLLAQVRTTDLLVRMLPPVDDATFGERQAWLRNCCPSRADMLMGGREGP